MGLSNESAAINAAQPEVLTRFHPGIEFNLNSPVRLGSLQGLPFSDTGEIDVH
jgi:hypothetical protein